MPFLVSILFFFFFIIYFFFFIFFYFFLFIFFFFFLVVLRVTLSDLPIPTPKEMNGMPQAFVPTRRRLHSHLENSACGTYTLMEVPKNSRTLTVKSALICEYIISFKLDRQNAGAS